MFLMDIPKFFVFPGEKHICPFTRTLFNSCDLKSYIIRFGLLAVALMLLLQLSKLSWFTYGVRDELLIVVFALSFLAFGIIIAGYFRKKGKANEQEEFELDENMLKEMAISKREYDVLQAMARGDSNKEIAESLFISESTVKTHVSNILIKLDSKRRTQAIQKAKEYRLIR